MRGSLNQIIGDVAHFVPWCALCALVPQCPTFIVVGKSKNQIVLSEWGAPGRGPRRAHDIRWPPGDLASRALASRGVREKGPATGLPAYLLLVKRFQTLIL